MALPMVFTLGLASTWLPAGRIAARDIGWSIELALLPIALAVVLPASLLFGLPIAWLLRRMRRKSGRAYRASGTPLGFVIPLAVLMMLQSARLVWPAFIGALQRRDDCRNVAA